MSKTQTNDRVTVFLALHLMTTAADILAEARTWAGTPFHHQGRFKGVGVDCLGLVVGVGRALGLSQADATGYPRQPDGAALLAGLDAAYQRLPLGQQKPGDIMVFRIRRDPQHLALLTERGGMIHVHAAVGRVVETSLDATWSARVVAAYRYPGVEG